MRERETRKRRRAWLIFAAGAAAAYFLDPQLGRTRRVQARDRMGAIARRGGRRLGRLGRRTGARAYGTWMKATHRHELPKDLDDVTLTHKIESEVLRGQAMPAGISVNAEDGMVILRGQVESSEQMEELTRKVLRVPGVSGVENLLHLPGQPAPNKARALEASARASDTTSS